MEIDELYFPIDIHTIRYDTAQSFDVFFKTDGGKMVLYCANGILVNEDVFKNIKKRDIRNLYIRNKDKLCYDNYVEKNLRKILMDTQISPSIKQEHRSIQS